MIHLEGAERRYGDVVAVSKIDLRIERGEVVGLLGHNGAGKTTLMKMVTGVLEPSSGSVRVDGFDLVTQRIQAQQKIGYLPENAPLYLDMTVFDHLVTLAELRGIPAERRESAALEAASDTGLSDRLGQTVRELSKGYRQRVGLACAILHKPAVLILDEPTNGLDPVQIQSIRSLIRRLAMDTTVVLSTHILQEVEAVCDRVVILIGGELVADSPLEDLLETHRILITLDTADAEPQLRTTTGVEDVQRSAHGAHWRYTLTIDPTRDTLVPALVEQAHRAGWTLYAVHPEEQTLDRVFQDLLAHHAETET